ncbi:MAG: DUF5803 family protein [Halodesulfurarchaeum sp.]
MKRWLAVGGLLFILVLAGCSGGVVSEQALNASATYSWDTEATVHVNVTQGTYRAVYDLDNQSRVELFQRGDLGDENPLPIRAIKFKYRNGTVVDASAITVSETDSRTVVELPSPYGKFAYTARFSTGQVFIPTGVKGSYEVVLPPGARMGIPIISVAEPGGYEKTLRNDRVHLRWENPSRDAITVSYYYQRDLYLFGGLLGLLVLVAMAGAVYFKIQLGSLESEREDVDVEEETD